MKRFLMFFCFHFLLSSASIAFGESKIYLRDNLIKAQQGDYIVTAQNKTYTLLHIYDKSNQTLTIEEINAPSGSLSQIKSWKQWVKNNAPGHTSWIIYTIDLSDGAIRENYSFTKNTWSEMSQGDNYLSTLLNLQLASIPLRERKKIGPPPDGSRDLRSVWQPQMVIEGKVIPNVEFEAWRTRWPKDGTELSGRAIEVYLPKESDKYSSYFPYWLQISGMVGKAKIRIVDSGHNLMSPKSRPVKHPNL